MLLPISIEENASQSHEKPIGSTQTATGEQRHAGGRERAAGGEERPRGAPATAPVDGDKMPRWLQFGNRNEGKAQKLQEFEGKASKIRG